MPADKHVIDTNVLLVASAAHVRRRLRQMPHRSKRQRCARKSSNG